MPVLEQLLCSYCRRKTFFRFIPKLPSTNSIWKCLKCESEISEHEKVNILDKMQQSKCKHVDTFIDGLPFDA